MSRRTEEFEAGSGAAGSTGRHGRDAFPSRPERGSALILSLFVLVLVSAMALALTSTVAIEAKMARRSVGAKDVFYLAEAGQEDGRITLYNANGSGIFTDDLQYYAGFDDSFNFNPQTIRATYDTSGNVTGFTGYGDDRPLRDLTPFGEGWYMAFLTNDPGEPGTTTDGNDRVMISGVAALPDRSMEIVQAVVRREPVFSIFPGATITILGPNPTFDGGSSSSKVYSGDDCTDVALSVPVVGVIGALGESQAETGVHKPSSYESGGLTGVATVVDVETSIDADWKDCQYLRGLAAKVKSAADVVGDSATPNSSLGTAAAPKTVYIEGDYDVQGHIDGGGVLWVTGELRFHGQASWRGALYAVGEGRFVRWGGGNGETEGAVFVANIAGPDGIVGTDDDCAGPDDIPGNSDDGIASGGYNNSGGGDHETRFCLDALTGFNPAPPYEITSFRQR